MTINPLPTRSYQVDEDADNPIIKVIPGPRLRSEDLVYVDSDKLYHFVSPGHTIGFGVTIPASSAVPPAKPDIIPPSVHAFWDLVCNVERLGLGANWSGWPALDDLLSEALDRYAKWEEVYERDPKNMRMAFHIFTAMCLSYLASPLRRRIPQHWLQTLQGGTVPEKETKVFPWIKSFDILTRELGLKVSLR